MNQSPPAARVNLRLQKATSGGVNTKTILIVEDDAALRHMLTKALSGSFNVYAAVDGADALELLGTITPPDLVITDVMMPTVDGLLMAQQIKKFPELRRIPIIFLTSRDAAKDVVMGINAGARHYMTKPFKVVDLIERARKILG